ncbi:MULTISPECIES: aspartate/glutamate racemase family protein [Paracoccus]|uniref:Hydantoin racemase n=1 Tax=Paracoccus versutus TaxID=34007 RepID=A0A369TTX2_PARVE|nr:MULTISPECIES: aspartate/glutamate racemase family protein [Paracoccus]WGR59524.1 aspartate/glutamate racemase family protein [Paracoccus ferrooxidans]SFY10460.1 allantoin racemase [Paracoccus pantotrophus]MBT0778776.1 aspartate/glutamate racemase family protein [Paracoccus sp. pheM1]MCJ1900574.1 aspartate/glutamate racemase family protein [Paracoccus versutus]MDF3905583.1 aspartate/glutamate racemase family protein [Paracoccus sp. AS002]
MRILVLNPNTTASMTEKIAAAARRAASPGTEIVAANPARGPASIEGFYDEAMSLSGLLQVIRETPDVDAVVIACFDDTGLDAARCLTDIPVVGIGEAAYHMASLISNRFSVVTTLARSVPALEHNLHRYGLWSRCGRVRSSEVAVLELEEPGSNASARIGREIARAIADDRAEAIVLGCAGMTDLTERLAAEHGVPVLDGVSCAVTLCEAMVRLKLRTSRLGGYAPVPQHKLAPA